MTMLSPRDANSCAGDLCFYGRVYRVAGADCIRDQLLKSVIPGEA
ncbi:MAG: hypothetical protein QNK19_09125 [Xanthomonadales bacterium]|nr:hypothetical protein [Xanthomonadales bacterium]